MAAQPTAAQQRLIDAAAARPDGHIIGGDHRTRQALRDHGWAEVYGYHFGPLERLTATGFAVSTCAFMWQRFCDAWLTIGCSVVVDANRRIDAAGHAATMAWLATQPR